VTQLQQELISQLMSTKCRCGSKKLAKNTFCRQCYFSLAPGMRQDLYSRIGRGYEEAHARAVKFLKGE
jgi:hypothetical protein